MSNGYESSQRHYTELCNRSSGSCGMGHVGARKPYSCDTLEDYWEDASVLLHSCHSWEPPSSPWLGATASAYVKSDEEVKNKRSTALDSHQIRPQRYSFDVNEYVTCSKAGCGFPPPLASCLTVSIKEGGRFVLKEMDADRPQGFFRARRGNGRLRLQLVLPDEVNDQLNEGMSSPLEDMTEPSVDFLTEFGRGEHGEEAITSNQADCSTSDEEFIRSHCIDKVGRSACFGNNEGLCGGGHVCKVEDFEIGRPTVQDGESEDMESNVCSTSHRADIGVDVRCAILDTSSVQQVGMRSSMVEGEMMDGFYSSDRHRDISTCRKDVVFQLETDNFLTFGKLKLNQYVAESSNSSIEQEPLWNVDVSNQALASLSPWSPKKICLHQSIVNMRPVFGLAIMS